jgi:hypothetical protein
MPRKSPGWGEEACSGTYYFRLATGAHRRTSGTATGERRAGSRGIGNEGNAERVPGPESSGRFLFVSALGARPTRRDKKPLETPNSRWPLRRALTVSTGSGERVNTHACRHHTTGPPRVSDAGVGCCTQPWLSVSHTVEDTPAGMSVQPFARRHLQTTDSPKVGKSSLSFGVCFACSSSSGVDIQRNLVSHSPLPPLSTSASPLTFLADCTHAGKLRHHGQLA